MNPDRSARKCPTTAALGSTLSGSSQTRGSPPCAATTLRNRSSAEPSAIDRRHFAEHEHLGGEFQRHLHEIVGTAALEALDALPDLQRIADSATEGRVHARDQGLHRLAELAANPRHALSKGAGIFPLRHEGSVAGLHVEHQCIDPFGQFLGEDRGGDQRDTFDRRRGVAERVEHAVGRRDLGRLADEHQATLAGHAAVGGEIEVDAKPRDALELVERTAGVAQTTARDHRHRHTAGGGDRRKDQARLVADAAGGMLVDLRSRDVGKVDHRP